MGSLEDRLVIRARELGFELAGIAQAAPAETFAQFKEWLDHGRAGEMSYLNRNADARYHPTSIQADVQSVIMLGMNYKLAIADSHQAGGPAGRVASYALGSDYHLVLRGRMKQLLGWLQEELPGCRGRCVVDTAPLLERDFARRAGLGWFGKNTMLLNKRLGSFFFLGAILINRKLAASTPHDTSHCGKCTACLDACPTQAFPEPGVLDARRCISYLTIELRSPIDSELRPHMGDWVFGCDICQDVCPWNNKAPAGSEPTLAPRPDLLALDLVKLLGMDQEQFRRRFEGTALLRPGRIGLLRNAAMVLGNCGDSAALPALRKLLEDADPVLRDAAQWAIARIEGQSGPSEFAIAQDDSSASC